MELRKVEINVPEEMVPFMFLTDGEAQLKRNAMLLYPYSGLYDIPWQSS